jgi:lipoic acid synthetase
MVGIGERDEEVLEMMDDVLARTGTPSGPTDILTIGQYLQPTRNHLPIDRFVTPEQFAMYHDRGIAKGFKVVQSGPLVRSSYHADHQADELSNIADERERLNTQRMKALLGE